jgi:predicted small metal-binding protein
MSIQVFYCKDCGLDCSFQVSGMNEREVAKKIIQHMDSDHNMKVIPADFMIKIKHAIKNKSAVKTVYLGPENKPLIVAMK